jgi:hypothetical protein
VHAGRASFLVCAGLPCLAGALLPASANAQAPPYLTQWGTLGSGNGRFKNPAGVAVDAFGNLFVSDAGNSRIQKFGSLPVPTKSTTWGRLKARYR